MARNALPGALKLQIPLSSETDILQELFSIGVGLSAAAAVGWTLSHTDRPIISGTIEATEPYRAMYERMYESQIKVITEIMPDIKGEELLKLIPLLTG